ncbi:MAG: beta-galactosidase small subunit, partial [Clostridia bacterium]
YVLKLPENIQNMDCFVNVSYSKKVGGEYVAKEQITLCETQFCYPETLEMVQLQAKIVNKQLVVNFGNNGKIVVDKKSGQLVSYMVAGKELVNQKPLLNKKGFLPNIYRGVIDNDRFIQILWKAIGYDHAKVCARGCKIKIVDNCVKIVNKYSLRFFGKIAGVKVNTIVDAKGKMHISATIKKGLKLAFYSEMPRFGLTLEMPKQFENVEYYGLGENENLCDFTQHAYVGVYKTKVSDMHTKYIKPQESGNHCKVRYAKITDNDGDGLMFAHQGEYFNFNANHFVLSDLLKATHTEDLQDKDTTNVQIDGFYRGTGTQSCGQGPLKQYKFDLKKSLTFEFEVKPIVK